MRTIYQDIPNYEKNVLKMEDVRVYQNAKDYGNDNVRHIANYALECIKTLSY